MMNERKMIISDLIKYEFNNPNTFAGSSAIGEMVIIGMKSKHTPRIIA